MNKNLVLIISCIAFIALLTVLTNLLVHTDFKKDTSVNFDIGFLPAKTNNPLYNAWDVCIRGKKFMMIDTDMDVMSVIGSNVVLADMNESCNLEDYDWTKKVDSN